MSDPGTPRFPTFESLAELLSDQRTQLLAYIDQHMGPVLRKQTTADAIYWETCQMALADPEQFDPPGVDPFLRLCAIAGQRIMNRHRQLIAAHKQKLERERSQEAP